MLDRVRIRFMGLGLRASCFHRNAVDIRFLHRSVVQWHQTLNGSSRRRR